MLSRPEIGLRGAAMFVDAILVIALAHALAGLTAAALWNWLPLSAGKATSALPKPSAGETATIEPADYAAIGAWHLFGRLEAAPPSKAPPAAPPAAVPLNLRLVGVFFVEQGVDRALALIAEGSSLERGYRVGEPLPGDARLEQVLRDHVIVSRGGRQEVLNLPRLEDVGRIPAPSGMPPAMPTEPGMMPEPVMPEPAAFRGPRKIDASAVVARLRSEASNRPQALEDIAFASPFVRNGQFLGFRLRPGRDRQLMQKLGLNNGDVITEVNGSRLNSPMQGLAMLQQLLNADQISVRVLRVGTEIPLTFSLGKPAAE